MARRSWPGMLGMMIVAAGVMVSGCSPRTRGDAAPMSGDAIREAAAEAHARQASVRLTLCSGGSARGMIAGMDEHGLLLVDSAVEGGRPRERALGWSDISRIEVARPTNNRVGLLMLGCLVFVVAAFAALGHANALP